ncbi:MAG: phosphonoacetaldehyde reductase [Planctomycetes bacterium]|nr:phosphonoacetaldehyde reductase [Planctomycetota bacterium]
MTQQIYSGYNCHTQLRSILKDFRPKNIFLVTGQNSYHLSGAESLIGKIISEFKHVRFYECEVNPKLEDIEKGVDLFHKEKCDFVVGIGGGSVMDIAKSISLLATQQSKIEEIIKKETAIKQREIPSVMIPTTAGTGSESTHFSTIYIGKTKYSLAHESLLPDIVILDPTFTDKLPASITACTGMDALCQSIESFWSVNSTEESRKYSTQAIRLLMSNLVKGVLAPDKNTRESLLIASNLAGKAINIAQTTAAHAISYPLTSYYNIPHGHAVALTLPYFIKLNSDIALENLQDKRGIDFVKNNMAELIELLDVHTPDEARDKIINIMKEIKLETRLSNLGIGKDSIKIIVENGFNPQRMKNNPKVITETELRSLIAQIL